jgi:hypothetical protein
LPARETRRFGAIGINASELLPVGIIDGNLPMAMLSTPVFAECGLLFGLLRTVLFHVLSPLSRKSEPPHVLV